MPNCKIDLRWSQGPRLEENNSRENNMSARTSADGDLISSTSALD